MYEKISELCRALNVLTNEELNDHGIEAIIINVIGTNLTGCEYTNGDLHKVVAMIGSIIANISKRSNIPLKDLLDIIYMNERYLKKCEKEGDDE